MTPLPDRVVEVRHPGDVMSAQAAAREVARDVRFSELECEQIALAASELASNLVRHANGGTLRVAGVADGPRTGIALETWDDGPGIAHPDRALTDGFSTAGGLGTGLGTVHRIMDDLDFSSRPGGGLKISCCRWMRPSTRPVFPREFSFGVATRAHRHEVRNGDAFVLRVWGDAAIAGVIDGLGHGEHAEQAAHAARAYVEDHFDQPLRKLFDAVDVVCRRTRGVVMALARFDPRAGQVEVASVGNVEVRLLGASRPANVVVRRGILGVNAPHAVVTSQEWSDETILVMHSDGLHTHWTMKDIPRVAWAVPAEAARALMDAQGKDDDDATVLVVRSARP